MFDLRKEPANDGQETDCKNDKTTSIFRNILSGPESPGCWLHFKAKAYQYSIVI